MENFTKNYMYKTTKLQMEEKICDFKRCCLVKLMELIHKYIKFKNECGIFCNNV